MSLSRKGRQPEVRPNINDITQSLDARLSIAEIRDGAQAATNAFAIPDILAMILSYTIPNPGDFGDSYRRQMENRAYPPWPFLLVCKHWRQVVLSTPALWSTFCLFSDSTDSPEVLFPLLEEHLRRSNTSPLTITASLSKSRADICTFWKKLSSSQHRWQIVTLDIFTTAFDFLPDPPAGPLATTELTLRLCELTALEYLHINFYSLKGLIDVELGLCPRLKHLVLLSGVDIREGDGAAGVNLLPSLRSVVIDLGLDKRNMDNGWGTLLRHSSGIQHLEIICMALDAVSIDIPLDLQLPNLQSMDISGTNVPLLLQCFASRMPSAIKLKISDADAKICDEFIAAYSTAIENTRASLEHLSFGLWHTGREEMPPLGEEELKRFLRSCAGLRSFEFFLDGHWPGNEFQTLCDVLQSAVTIAMQPESSQDGQPLLPRLNELEMRFRPSSLTDVKDFSCVRNLILRCQEKFIGSEFRFELSIFESRDVQSNSEDFQVSVRLRRELRDLCKHYECKSSKGKFSEICIKLNKLEL